MSWHIFIDQLAHQMPKYGDTLMTIAEKLREEGKKETLPALLSTLKDFNFDDRMIAELMENYKQKLNHPHDE